MEERESASSAESVVAVEVIAIAGFALYQAWMLVCFFWLPAAAPDFAPSFNRDISQLSIFVGMVVGIAALAALGKRPAFNVFHIRFVILECVLALLAPAHAVMGHFGIFIPYPAVCLCNFASGVGASAVLVSWLDVASRLGSERYSRFSGFGVLVGGLLFALVVILPHSTVPVFCIAYLLLSVVLLPLCSAWATGNRERAPQESVGDPWKFSRELEPSFFMFMFVFALTFMFLFNTGSSELSIGLVSSLAGAAVVVVLSILNKSLGITFYQRILMVVTATSCVFMPLTNDIGRLVLSCVVIASWAMFLCVNYSYLIRKIMLDHKAPLYREAPIRLLASNLGFATGWAFATVIDSLFGAHSVVFSYLRPTTAVILVIIAMLFPPNQERHASDGSSSAAEPQVAPEPAIQVTMTNAELFDARCDAVASLYQLSPREREILGYLAKGRNASYITEALVLSPHTVKSHIYNLYRKLDIHSQQKLMDFVEEFPLDFK